MVAKSKDTKERSITQASTVKNRSTHRLYNSIIMRDVVASPVVDCVSTESNSEETETGEENDINLEDICEVVLSLKCRQCDFLCNDRSILARHVKQTHSRHANSYKNRATAAIHDGIADVQNPTLTPTRDRDGSVSVGDSQPQGTGKYKHTDRAPASKGKHGVKSSGLSTHASTSSSTQKTLNGLEEGDKVTDDSVEDVFLCAECDIVFSSREMCCIHMHKVHGLKQFSTDFIQEEIIAKPNESPHISKARKTKLPRQFTIDAGAIVPKKFIVTKDTLHMCSKCSIRFETVEVMMFHEQCHNTSIPLDKDYNRSIKQIKSKSKRNPDTSNTSVAAKGFLCPVCESKGTGSHIFSKWGACAWHLWKEHRIDCELHTCSVCKQFKSHLIARVKDHEQLHSSKASYKCKTCGKTFKQLKQLRCHEKYHKDNATKLPPPSDSRWYTPKECPICKRILSDSKCLKKHISAVHNKLKPYVCNICGHTSARKAELQLHVRQHTGEKPYKCPICNFQTGDHNSLRKHKLRHGDERPYSCPYCDYKCIQSCAFKKHIVASHPGQEVVYLCQLCSHASVNEALFMAHQKDHSDGRIASACQTELHDSNEYAAKNSPKGSRRSEEKPEDLVPTTWSEGEDGVEVIDNGGVTIPAPSSPLNNSIENHRISNAEESNESSNSNSSLCSLTHEKFDEILVLRVGETVESTAGFILLKADSNIHSQSETGVLETKKEKFSIPNSLIQSHPPHVYGVTPSIQTLTSSASPRHPTNLDIRHSQHQDIRGNDYTESSSEVITNPDQLIENIQLTPLDLTDIIACSEQTNDDGMLQRLLDMSGV